MKNRFSTRKLLTTIVIFLAMAAAAGAWEHQPPPDFGWGYGCEVMHEENGAGISIIDANVLLVGPVLTDKTQAEVEFSFDYGKLEISTSAQYETDALADHFSMPATGRLLHALSNHSVVEVRIGSAIAKNYSLNGASQAITRMYDCLVDHKPEEATTNAYEDNETSGRCKLVVAGKSIIDGYCLIEMSQDGSFKIRNEGQLKHFAVVLLDESDFATAYWNEEIGANHAHSVLGAVSRNGACWENSQASICAWR